MKKLLAAAFACLLPVVGQNATAISGSSLDVRSSKLARLVPNLFGTNGLVLPNPDHDAHFSSAFQANFAPLNTALAARLTSLPIPSPASGFTYTFDPSIGVYTRSTSSFGPLLAERAETIGKNKFFAGFNFQSFGFRSLDGLALNNVPSVLEHLQTTPDPNFKKDVITTQNQIDVKISQWTSFFTYGLSRRADFSVAIPYLRANMDVFSKATIQRIGTADQAGIHYFIDAAGNRTTTATFHAAGQASGIGDVLVRTKYTVVDRSRVKVALGLEGRMPTGDPYEFLGAGAFGVKPFVALSIAGQRFSPHFNAGYQYNGKSVLAGDIRTGEARLLPKQMSYAAGFESGITKNFTFSADLVAQQVFSADRVQQKILVAADNRKFPQVTFVRGNFSAYSLASGVKVNPVSTLILSFNLLYQVNEAGLRAGIVPLIGLSYSF